MKIYDVEISLIDDDLLLSQGGYDGEQVTICLSKKQVELVAKLMIQAVEEGEPCATTAL
jgi:hypothetical protein